jgi:predicted lipoprotein with Yx(FWY)xxD motif
MKALLLTIGVIAASITLGVGAASAAPAKAKVSLASTALGRILVDGHGRTLYLFANDRHGKSTCTGACAAFWPPLIASGKPVAGSGLRSTLLGTTRRPDGRLQVTYNHHPLYTFAKDVRKGDTNGEELNAYGAEWYALSSAGAKVERGNAMSTGTGYGY